MDQYSDPYPAAEIGQKLLAELDNSKTLTGTADHPALAWRRCGLCGPFGADNSFAQTIPLPITAAVDGAMLALKSLSKTSENLPLNGSLLLGERSRLRKQLSNRDGFCRLLDTADGRIALNLARDEDWDLLEAWLQIPATSWQDIEREVRSRDTRFLVSRAVELGLAIARDHIPSTNAWFNETAFEPETQWDRMPLVVDLSSLWAGPLTGNLLHLMGAKVIKVESWSRPDGARAGNEDFFNLLNAGKRCIAFDLESTDGRADLIKILELADIVIEASRPRAMRQLGIDAEALVSQKPGKLWLRFLAYGDDHNRIGFGDDIGIGAGLGKIMERAWGSPAIVGDAIADPVSGIFGALAGWSKWQTGGGRIIELSMRDVVRRAMLFEHDGTDLSKVAKDWQNIVEADSGSLYPMRNAAGIAEKIGASTRKFVGELC